MLARINRKSTHKNTVNPLCTQPEKDETKEFEFSINIAVCKS